MDTSTIIFMTGPKLGLYTTNLRRAQSLWRDPARGEKAEGKAKATGGHGAHGGHSRQLQGTKEMYALNPSLPWMVTSTTRNCLIWIEWWNGSLENSMFTYR
ncbi:hypothetical protein COCNU_06G000690 [Cocos nucifera]|uniref:Uncharacterized protein n=1 Tax=Cocos nucifera TaxID=13894 RepID=A0A8K0N270_COCNU|nr:hypothetical protein COCNU_06G000690 [Cocos nucifera]